MLSEQREPISHEARRVLRDWKVEQGTRWERLQKLLHGGHVHTLAREFVLRTALRRQRRAFDKLNQLIAPLTYPGAVRFGADPVASWLALRPTAPQLVASRDPGEQQQSVGVFRVIMYRREADGAYRVEGRLASLEVPDHCLGRLLDRGGLDTPLAAIVMGLHEYVRDNHLDDIALRNGFFEIPSMVGRFVAERIIAKGQNGQPTSLVRVKTWLRDDQSSASLTDLAAVLRARPAGGFALGQVARLR